MKRESPRQTSTKIDGGWPGPPLSYCILIAPALCSSPSGSLTVQHIRQSTRFLLLPQLLVQNGRKRDHEGCRSLISSWGAGMWQPGPVLGP